MNNRVGAALVSFSLFMPAAIFAQQAPLVAPTEARSPQEQQALFRLPKGFQIELIAAEPEIQKPMNLAFDAAGRLYVTQSVEYPFPATSGTPRDTIKVITDTNGDGVPDKVSTFAKGLNIPIGVLPLNDRVVLGYGIPRIDRFEDTDGDGQADARKPYFTGFGFDDTHGMASSFNWWLDGWVYACHGFRNTSTVAGADGRPITMNSGNTYRFLPDGSRIEYFTHGQVNPFGMAFDPLGNVFTADCHSRPISMLLRGAYYPSFGKPHDGLGFGPEMIAHDHGSTGICGVVYYAAAHFPAEYHDTVFIGNPVTGRINHDRLEPHGSSYRAVEQPDFVSCEDLWFRPVDLKLAPDGSMYVADFYNCIIGHYEVDLHHPRRDRSRGRIWRIVYRGEGAERPSFTSLEGKDLSSQIEALGHPNLVVRTLATHLLAASASAQVVPLARDALESANPRARAHALWVLTRRNALDDFQIERLARDPDRLVRVHLVKSLAGRDWAGGSGRFQALVTGLLVNDSDPFVRRACAETLAQHASDANVRPLLSALKAAPTDDTHLVHALRIALRDNLLPAGALNAARESFETDTEARQRVADVALGIATPESGQYLLDHLRAGQAREERLPEFLRHAMRYAGKDQLPELHEYTLALKNKVDDQRQVELLRAAAQAAQARGAALPEAYGEWGAGLAGRFLNGPGEESQRTGIELAREFRVLALFDTLAAMAQEPRRAIPIRQQSAEALAALEARRALPVLSAMIENGNEPLPLRLRSAEVLGAVNSPEAREALLRLLPGVPEAVGLAMARALAGSREGAAPLLSAMAEGKAAARFVQDRIVAERLKSLAIPGLEEKLQALRADLPSEEERDLQLAQRRLAGFARAQTNPRQGAMVFQKICANCHRAAGQGTKVGPDLDGIGSRGVERLLEDILLPSRNVDQAFRATVFELEDGKTQSAFLLREEGKALVVVNDQGKELRLNKDQVVEQRTLRLSPMPASIAEQLSEAEFNDLLAYVLSLKGKPAP
jgi:putative heme-binding domain-containing protein